jgi:hypothetical protein
MQLQEDKEQDMSLRCRLSFHDMKVVLSKSVLMNRRNYRAGGVQEECTCVLVHEQCTRCNHEEAYVTDGNTRQAMDINYARGRGLL